MRHNHRAVSGFFGPGRPFSVPFHVEKHKSGKYYLQKTTFLEIIVFIDCQTLLWRFLADNHSKFKEFVVWLLTDG